MNGKADPEAARRMADGLADGAVSPFRAELAALYDTCLERLARHEAPCRRLLGRLSRMLLDHRHYNRLGFSRLGDYTRERLGLAERDVQEAAAVSQALVSLPQTARRFDAGELNWTKTRLLASAATATNEQYWLALAARSSAAELHRAIQRGRDATCINRTSPEPTRDGAATVSTAPDDSVEIDGEPCAEFTIVCSRRTRSLWRSLVLLASRSAGRDLAQWQAAEVIAAEALSGADLAASREAADVADQLRAAGPRTTACRRDAARGLPGTRARRRSRAIPRSFGQSPSVAELRALGEVQRALHYLAGLSRLAAGELQGSGRIDERDAHAVDAALRRVVDYIQQIDGRLSCVLVRFVELGLFRDLGFASSGDYFVERLGISVRKTRGLLAVERTSRACADELAEAYRMGTLSWLRALALLRVVTERNAHAWIRRARQITLRRLLDEVEWALQRRDSLAADTELLPPPVGLDLEEDRVQIGAALHRPGTTRSASVADVPTTTLRFRGPASVIVLLQQAIHACRRHGEPLACGLERMLEHVAEHWQAQPRHRDPVFARDGWRCAVPACSERDNLHDHHIEFRSRGGSNALSNRVSVCWWHHQQGIHGSHGVVRARGRADRGIVWELGCRPGRRPLLRLVGDSYEEQPIEHRRQ